MRFCKRFQNLQPFPPPESGRRKPQNKAIRQSETLTLHFQSIMQTEQAEQLKAEVFFAHQDINRVKHFERLGQNVTALIKRLIDLLKSAFKLPVIS